MMTAPVITDEFLFLNEPSGDRLFRAALGNTARHTAHAAAGAGLGKGPSPDREG